MTDDKLTNSDKSQWDLYVQGLDKNDEEDMIEFEEEFEKYDVSHKFDTDGHAQSDEQNKKHFRLNIKNKNSLTPKSFKDGIAIDDTLDLHGKTLHSAYNSFIDFIESSYAQGHRNLLVITGKGLNTHEGIGAIKKEFKNWTSKDNIADKIIRTTYANNKHGGEGAFYIFLKQQ